MFGSWLRNPELLDCILDCNDEVFHIGFLKVDSGSVDCVSTNLYIHSRGYTIESTLVNNHIKEFKVPGEHILKDLRESESKKESGPKIELLAYNQGQIVLGYFDEIFDIVLGRNICDDNMYITDSHSKINGNKIMHNMEFHKTILDKVINPMVRQDKDFVYMLGLNHQDMNYAERMKEIYVERIKHLPAHSNN